MTDFEFKLFWGLCLLALVVFMSFIGALELNHRKKERERNAEADKLRQAYKKRQANKKRWEQNMVESEKLFEGVDG
jgi:Na+-transporting methylmalonyl-CoA/oxaloacetate decarboxylase gamma subunit